MKEEPLHEKISEYLDKDKAARFEELEAKGIVNLTQKEGQEHTGLMYEIVVQKTALGEFDSPFKGKCRRCGREFTTSVPEITNPGEHSIYEIATMEWCADCNRFTMNVLFRESSAYKVEARDLHDPMRERRQVG